MFVRGVDQTVSNIASDGRCEKHRFLGDKANLRTQPFDVQVADVHTIEFYRTIQRIVKTFNERDYPEPEAPTKAAALPAVKVTLIPLTIDTSGREG